MGLETTSSWRDLSRATPNEIEFEIAEMDKQGMKLSLKDGLILSPSALPQPARDDATTEEVELEGKPRPQKGVGWWGRGPFIWALRKGEARDFVDGAGLCSRGRWPIQRRVLPDDFTLWRLQQAFKEVLLKMKIGHGKLLLKMVVGHIKEQPFDVTVVEEVRVNLRLILKESGHGDGLLQADDLAYEGEHFEI